MSSTLEKFAIWLIRFHGFSFKHRKSIVKRIYPRLLTDYPFTVDFYGLKYEGNTKNLLDRLVFIRGAHEKDVLFLLKDLAADDASQVVLDVGANIGQHSLFLSQYVKTIHAFEPFEPVREQFLKHIEVNNIKNISIHPVGLSNENSLSSFYAPPDSNLGVGSFLKDFSEKNVYAGELRLVIGDEELERLKVKRVDIVKIDVEGFERYVLEGLEKTLKSMRPVVIFECSPEIKSTFNDEKTFRGCFPEGYEFLILTDPCNKSVPYKLTPFDFDSFDILVNIVAFPVGRLDKILKP